jgi:hypothetical protein
MKPISDTAQSKILVFRPRPAATSVNYVVYIPPRGTKVAQWLRYCVTNEKVAGSLPDGVIEFFIDINPSDNTMALGSTQHLTEMSTRNISWV